MEWLYRPTEVVGDRILERSKRLVRRSIQRLGYRLIRAEPEQCVGDWSDEVHVDRLDGGQEVWGWRLALAVGLAPSLATSPLLTTSPLLATSPSLTTLESKDEAWRHVECRVGGVEVSSVEEIVQWRHLVASDGDW